jgi:glycosyltransferase involved in cell wall biosynthesis
MRIGLFAHRLSESAATGVGRYIRELSIALVDAAGPEDSITLSSTPETEPPSGFPPVVQTRVMSWPRPLAHAAWCLGAGPRLELSLDRLDVVHLLYPFPPARSAARQVVTVHDLFPLAHPAWYPRSERLIFRRTIALTLRRAERIVVPSAYVRSCLVNQLGVDPGRVIVVPHGVSGSYANPGSPDDQAAVCRRFGVEPGRFAVAVGALNPRKNLTPLIRAVGELQPGAVTLLLVGPDGYEARATEAEIAKLNGAADVRRTGYLPDSQVAALVKSAAVLVHPALEEGFGLVPLEAMAVGTPVIAARASSIPEVVGEAALLVDEPTQPDAWAQALSELIETPARRAELGAAGERQAATFSWQRSAATVLDLYRDVAQT